MRCKFQPRAKTDLREIAQYIGRDNPRRSISYIKEIKERCQKLTQRPDSGRPRPYEKGLRSVVFGKYVVFYITKDDDLIVVRILHGARDIDEIMSNR